MFYIFYIFIAKSLPDLNSTLTATVTSTTYVMSTVEKET